MIIHFHEAAEQAVASKLTEHDGNFNEVVQFVRGLEANIGALTAKVAELSAKLNETTETAVEAVHNLTDAAE